MDTLTEIADQILHMLWAFAPLAFFWLVSGRPHWRWKAVVGGMVLGLAMALPRELVDQWPIERPLDTLMDLAFFMIGGGLSGLLGWKAN